MKDITKYPEPGYIYEAREPGVARRLAVRNKPNGMVIYRRELGQNRWSSTRFCHITTWRTWVRHDALAERAVEPAGKS